MTWLLATLLFDPLCLLAALAAMLYAFARRCVAQHTTCPVRVCDHLSKKGRQE